MIEVDLRTKQCSICMEVKEIKEFYKQNKINKSGENYVYYNPECKKCSIKRSQKRNEENKENYLSYLKEYRIEYLRRPEVKKMEREKHRKLRKRGVLRKWQNNNPEKIKSYSLKRNTKQHEITNDEWVKCKEYFSFGCAYCGMSEKLHKELNKQQLHRDHVVHDGSNKIDNCVPSCKSCNSSKGEYKLDGWYNKDNENFTQERLDKVNKWLEDDCKLLT